MHVHIVLCCGVKTVLFTNKLSECWCHITVYKVSYIKAFREESYTNMHVHIVLCCGAKRVSFTNKLSECWCRITNPYLFTKFHASQHLGKRVIQRCMFTLFFVVV